MQLFHQGENKIGEMDGNQYHTMSAGAEYKPYTS
jgi:hypothetical protein